MTPSEYDDFCCKDLDLDIPSPLLNTCLGQEGKETMTENLKDKTYAVHIQGYGFSGKPKASYDDAVKELARNLGKNYFEGAIFEKIATASSPTPEIEITKL